MKKDTEKTRVKFLVNLRDNILMAFFPDELYNKELYGDTMLTCYEHIGQHSSCDIAYANECRLATKKEYKALKKELESIGYNLEVITDHTEPKINCHRPPTQGEIKFGHGATHYREFTPSEIGLNKKGELKTRFKADGLFYSRR